MDLEHDLELAGGGAVERLGRDGEAARDYARENLSPATRRAYQTRSVPELGRHVSSMITAK